jgi:hypothetical protein
MLFNCLLNIAYCIIVLWYNYCCGFNADSDPAFYLKPDPDLDSGSKTNADLEPNPDQTFPSLTVAFLHEKYLLCW